MPWHDSYIAAHRAAHHRENQLNQQDQSAADRAEYEWKQRRIREAVAAYKRWEQQQRRSFN